MTKYYSTSLCMSTTCVVYCIKQITMEMFCKPTVQDSLRDLDSSSQVTIHLFICSAITNEVCKNCLWEI